MKILYYECFSGISGDMNLAAMIDLGIAPSYIENELAKLGLANEFELTIQKDARKGIHGTRVGVVDKTHCHHGDHHHAPHRNLADIEKIITDSDLASPIKQTACAMFLQVAQAEAKIHGKELYQVHFHEVGAVDSIVDIVAAAICYHALEIDEVWCSAVELGGGFVQCAHGLMPVPAPATMEILQGCPTTRGAVAKECTTPTGAAILKTLVSCFSEAPQLTINKTAYGIGHRDTEIPNVLRVSLAEVKGESVGVATQQCTVLQCNIDDMTAESLGYVMDKLFEEGAMDAYFTPIIMKKNRPATCVSVLCSSDEKERFIDLLIVHTTTLGVRSSMVEKTILDRSLEKHDTSLGPVRVKRALYKGQFLRLKPEYDDCKKIAEKQGLPLAAVYSQVQRDIEGDQ